MREMPRTRSGKEKRLTAASQRDLAPLRGEVRWIGFDPSIRSELTKVRPAVVLSVASVGILPLRIVVPVTEWDAEWEAVPWMVLLKRHSRNGLSRDSAADCVQVKSLSLRRFRSRLGVVTADEIEEIAAGVALCVGAP